MTNSSDDLKVADPKLGATAVNETLEAFLATADVERSFGKPVEYEAGKIIPASEVLVGMGFGLGYGSGSGGEVGEEERIEKGQGGGGGGGGQTLSRPVAVIVADSAGVRVEPIIDVTKLGVTLLTALGAAAVASAKILKRARDWQ